jgi:uncharacterized protein (TIGR04255 family)
VGSLLDRFESGLEIRNSRAVFIFLLIWYYGLVGQPRLVSLMRPKNLSHKPLIEAILEFRWQPSFARECGVDPDLRLFIGKFHDLLAKEYPEFEVLGAAAAPEQMTPNIAQYRFRRVAGGWPLVQIGSGVITLNEASSYSWEDYKIRAEKIIDLLFQHYPSDIVPTTLELRYINAVHVDFEKEDALSYLSEKFRVGVSLPKVLFEKNGVQESTALLGLQAAFPTRSPAGSVHFRMAKGKANDKDALIWETVIHSEGKELPQLPKEFSGWLDAAHALAEEWFFKLVEGELLRQFE